MKFNDFSMTFPTTNSLIRNSMNDHKKATKCPVSLTVFPSQFKFDGNFVSLSLQWSLQNFVHGTTAVLSSWSWHAQKFVAIWWPATELQQGEFSSLDAYRTHMNKTLHVEGVKIFASILLIAIYIFIEFFRFPMTFPGKMPFSSPWSNSMTFQGKI